MVLLELTAEEFLHFGLELVGFSEARQQKVCKNTNLKCFRSSFGISPKSCCCILLDFQTTQIVAACIAKPKIRYMMMAIYWLRHYPTEVPLSGTFKMDEKTIREHIKKYVRAIQALAGQKVRSV